MTTDLDAEPDDHRTPPERRVGPEALLLPLLGLLWWALEGGFEARGGDAGRPSRAVDEPPAVRTWAGRWEDGEGGAIRARLSPLHADPATQRFDARVLRVRLRLPEGEPWRLELTGEGEPAPRLRLDGPELTRDGARELAPPRTAAAGPVASLFAVPDSELELDAVQLGLWGVAPEPAPLALDGLTLADGTPVALVLEPDTRPATRLPRSLARLASAAEGRDARREVDGRPHVAGGPGDRAEAPAWARDRIDALEARVAELDAELTRSVDTRIERERAYVEFQRSLAGLERADLEDQVRMILGLAPRAGPQGDAAAPEAVDEPAPGDVLEPERAAAEARARTLNVLLRSEGVWSLELLEAGELLYESPGAAGGSDEPVTEGVESATGDGDDGTGTEDPGRADTVDGSAVDGPAAADERAVAPEPGADPAAASAGREVSPETRALLESARSVGTGPVVFRQLDDRGRLAGGIRAARLRLEGSRSGRSLTLVLEDGAFLEGGRERPFEGGAHRVELRHVDPEPFMEALPELFAPRDLARRVDDGRWSLPLVRNELNELLRREPSGARYRLTWLGGVVGTELREVELELFDDGGVVERRVVADVLALELDPEARTLVLRLRDGATLRGDEKAPFLDGRMRIVVPRVDVGAWRAADLPGLGAPRTRGAAADDDAGAAGDGSASAGGGRG